MVALQSIAEIKGGGKLGLSGRDFVEDGFPAYGAGGVNGSVLTAEYRRPAVVLSSIGARCGRCFLAEGQWTSLANTQVILPDLARVDPRFLWYQLNDEGRWHRSGTGQPFIKPADVKSHQVWIPPLDDQRRIATILGHAKALHEAERAIVVQLEELDTAIFFEMFGQSASTASDWPRARVGDLISDGPQNGIYKPASQYGRGVPIVRIDAFQHGTSINVDRLKRLRLSDAEARLYALSQGDVLINRVNSRTHLGKATLVSRLPETTVFESNMMRVRLDSRKVLPHYLITFLGTDDGKGQIQRAAKDAVNQSSINQKDVGDLELPLPPLHLQEEYVLRSEAVRRERERCKSVLDRLAGLFASLQSRAFRGELTRNSADPTTTTSRIT